MIAYIAFCGEEVLIVISELFFSLGHLVPIRLIEHAVSVCEFSPNVLDLEF